VFSAAPADEDCGEGSYPIDNTDEATMAAYPYTVGAAVASIAKAIAEGDEPEYAFTYFTSFEDAVEARDGEDDVITLLADIEEPYTLESGTLKVAKNGKNITVQAPEGYTLVESTDEDGVTTYTVEIDAVAKNLNTGVKYPTLAAALADASSGQTVVPLTNITDEAYIMVMSGVTLDLNGYNVTGATLFYVTGTLVDTGTTRGRFSAEAYYLGKSVNSEFPIYDSSANAYALFNLSVQQWDNSSPYGFAYRLMKNGDERAAAVAMISSSENHGRFAVAVNVYWSEGNGAQHLNNVKTVAFANEMLDLYTQDPTKLYQINFAGLDAIEGSITAIPTFIVYDANDAIMMTLYGEQWSIK
jgi:hypothetical protein